MEREATRESAKKELGWVLGVVVQVLLVVAVFFVAMSGLGLVGEVAHEQVWCAAEGPAEISTFGRVFAESSPVPGVAAAALFLFAVGLLVSEAILSKGLWGFMRASPLLCAVVLLVVAALQLTILLVEGGEGTTIYVAICCAAFTMGGATLALFHFRRSKPYLILFAALPILGATIALLPTPGSYSPDPLLERNYPHVTSFVLRNPELLILGLIVLVAGVFVATHFLRKRPGAMEITALTTGMWGFVVLSFIAIAAVLPQHAMCVVLGFEGVQEGVCLGIGGGLVVGLFALATVQRRRWRLGKREG